MAARNPGDEPGFRAAIMLFSRFSFASRTTDGTGTGS